MDCDSLVSLLHEGYLVLHTMGIHIADSPYALLPAFRPSLASLRPFLEQYLESHRVVCGVGFHPPVPAVSSSGASFSSSDVVIDGVRYVPVGPPAAVVGGDSAVLLDSLRLRVRSVVDALPGGSEHSARLRADIVLASHLCDLWVGNPSVYASSTSALSHGKLHVVPGLF